MTKATAKDFADRHGVPWPCGYGARESIALFGAWNRYNMIPGYEVRPTLFLIADGVVRWCDGHARTHHGDANAPVRALEEQIERALAQK